MPKVLNLSSRDLTEDEIEQLKRGPKFCPSTNGQYLEMKSDISELTRKMKIIDKYSDTPWEDASLIKEKSNREIFTDNRALQHITTQIENLEPQHTRLPPNLPSKHQAALKHLESDNSIVIKKADKSNIFVIMDTSFYKEKLVLQDHLLKPTYEPSPQTADKKAFKDLQNLITKHKDCLTNNEFKYVTQYEWKSSNFYIQPKINKCIKLREIISNSNSAYV